MVWLAGAILLERKRGWWGDGAYTQFGLLSLDAGLDFVALDFYHKVAGFEVAGYAEADVKVADGLGPLVGERGLLLSLLDPCRRGFRSCRFYRCNMSDPDRGGVEIGRRG